MDSNNNDVVKDAKFYLKNFFAIFGNWFLAIVYTIFPFLLKRKSVENKVILITGAGSGLGQLLSVEFAKLGAIIVAWDINETNLNKTKKLVEETGSKCFNYIVDVSKKSNIYEASKKVREEVGFVFMLINNAGIVTGKDFLELKDEEIELTMNVNAMAHIWSCKAFLPEMVQRNEGHLVSIASLAGNVGVNRLTDYCASKFCAVGFEESLRLELFANNSNVKSTVVCPAYINTGMFEGVKSLIPLLDPKYVVEKIVDSILKDQMIIVLPRSMYFMLILKQILPSLSGANLVKVLGVDTSMNQFVGRNKNK